MGLYTKLDEQIDYYYEVLYISESLSNQNFYIKILLLLLFIFILFMINKRNI